MNMRATHTLIALFVLLTTILTPSAALALDPCDSTGDGDPNYKITLVSAGIGEQGQFYGMFRIENQRTDATLEIPGIRRGKEFWIIRPEREIEFRDPNGRWTPILEPPGSFMQRPDVLSIPIGRSATFRSDLVTQATAQVALQFRLLVRIGSLPRCIISRPFVSIPSRPKINGFESVPN